MKRENLILIITSLITIALTTILIYVLQGNIQPKDLDSKEVQLESKEVQSVEIIPQNEILFDLQYDKYLIPPPYKYEANGTAREFRFELMLEHVLKAQAEFSKGNICYVDNYKNRNGIAPYYDGKSIDEQGVHKNSSAPAYFDEQGVRKLRYIEDGRLLIITEDKEGETKVKLFGGDEREYSIPEKYVPTNDCLNELLKIIVIDRANQNIAAFEIEDGLWRIVSYSLATTGMNGKYHKETPLGYFYAIEKKERFHYLKDGTNIIEGYAPYAIRFTQGAYIHGVSTSYIYGKNGGKIDRGIKEFSNTIGTIPLSHKCVRNYTSHAKFLYDWYEKGKTIVIVIE